MEWKAALNDRESRIRRWFDGTIIVLIIISLVAFAVETLPDLPGWAQQTLWIVEVLIVALFAFEYLIRIWLAERKLGFIFSFFGIVDLLVILPLLLAPWVAFDLRTLRVVRLIRLIRVLKLARYSRAVQRFHRALAICREELVLFFCVALIMLYVSATGIYHFEHAVQPENFKSVFHGLWWALVTLTTVGYGDVVPVTVGGRFFTFLLLMVGIGVFSVPAGLLASALSVARMEEEKQPDSENENEKRD